MCRIPKRLKQRPQFKGLPIPYIALINDDGKPDFRVTDEAKRHSVMMNKWCQLCGQPLGKFSFFVGGKKAAAANQYFEPGCHLDCLIYAMRVCPFIAGKMQHVDLAKVQKEYEQQVSRVAEGVRIQADDSFTVEKDEYWVIKKAIGWSYVRTHGNTILLIPAAVKTTPPLHAQSMSAEDWNKTMKWLMT